jgi:hypothetical protein
VGNRIKIPRRPGTVEVSRRGRDTRWAMIELLGLTV